MKTVMLSALSGMTLASSELVYLSDELTLKTSEDEVVRHFKLRSFYNSKDIGKNKTLEGLVCMAADWDTFTDDCYKNPASHQEEDQWFIVNHFSGKNSNIILQSL
jgi:hypothetical protein